MAEIVQILAWGLFLWGLYGFIFPRGAGGWGVSVVLMFISAPVVLRSCS